MECRDSPFTPNRVKPPCFAGSEATREKKQYCWLQQQNTFPQETARRGEARSSNRLAPTRGRWDKKRETEHAEEARGRGRAEKDRATREKVDFAAALVAAEAATPVGLQERTNTREKSLREVAGSLRCCQSVSPAISAGSRSRSNPHHHYHLYHHHHTYNKPTKDACCLLSGWPSLGPHPPSTSVDFCLGTKGRGLKPQIDTYARTQNVFSRAPMWHARSHNSTHEG